MGVLTLHLGEPRAGSWQAWDVDSLRTQLLPHRLIVVDGGSGSGKSTFTALTGSLLDAAVVHTDDVAWHHHATDWADELVENIVVPWRDGRSVSYRPPGWHTHHRPGAITVPPTRHLLIEGVGAGRASLAKLADLVIWVQTDRAPARPGPGR